MRGREEDASGKWCMGGIQANDHASPSRVILLRVVLTGFCLGELWRLASRRHLPPGSS